ncbi:uncharacterized protein [Miscanthus floridulus]|uniref:uncharacterized protein n=1 Tax=Miscanthus floridulus TaxID=154761 RepID=UPI003459476C
MVAYYREVQRLEDKFDSLKLNHIPRRLNEAADALAKAAFGRELVPMSVFASDQHKPSMRYNGLEQAHNGLSNPASGANQPTALSGPEVMEIEQDPIIEHDPLIEWIILYLDYLLRDTLSMDKTEARRLTRRTKSFVLMEGELYKRSHIGIVQCCVPIEQGSIY